MRLEMYLDADEIATPIKIADALINNGLENIELEEIAEHLLVYCNKQSIREMQPTAVPYYKESEE